MSPTTLFKVYITTTLRREYARENRGTSLGISKASDKYAIEWQRFERLAKKLEVRILRCLKEYESYERHNMDNAARLTGGYYE